MLSPALARFRLALFATLLIVFRVMERWVLVAIVGACLVFVVLRASFRTRPAQQSPAAVPRSLDVATNHVATGTSESSESPEFEMNPATVTAIRDRGGNLYIWADQAGLLQARATAPAEQIIYDPYFSHGCSIHIDRGIGRIDRLHVTWKRLPWPHFSAVYTSPLNWDRILDYPA
jgi:hypothetical protein